MEQKNNRTGPTKPLKDAFDQESENRTIVLDYRHQPESNIETLVYYDAFAGLYRLAVHHEESGFFFQETLAATSERLNANLPPEKNGNGWDYPLNVQVTARAREAFLMAGLKGKLAERKADAGNKGPQL